MDLDIGMKHDFDAFRAEGRADFDAFKTEIRRDFEVFKTEIRRDLGALEQRMTIKLGTMMLAMTGVLFVRGPALLPLTVPHRFTGPSRGYQQSTFSRENRVEHFVPQPDATGYPGLVRDQLDIRRQIYGQMFGVAAADIKRVKTNQRRDAVQRPLDPPVPALAADRPKRDDADELVVGLALVNWVLTKLQVGRRMAILEQGKAHTGAQRDDALQPLAADDTETLNLGVVEYPRRLAKFVGQLRGQRKIPPVRRAEIGRRQHLAATYHAREAHRNPVEAAQ